MTFVSGFANDLFISYASVDDQPDAQEKRWVSQFRHGINMALRQRLGSDISMYMDRTDLRPNEMLDEQLKNVRQSAIFVAICSPSYVAREWTLGELKAFCAAIKGSEALSRVAFIELLPFETDRLPTELRTLTRLRFYNETNGVAIPLTPALTPELYYRKMHELAHGLSVMLRKLQTSALNDRASPAVSEGGNEPKQEIGSLKRPSPAVPEGGNEPKQEIGSLKGRKIFICYRRDGTADFAGRVHDRLERDLGRDLVFMDVDSIPLGANFVKALQEAVGKCDVLLAVIGRGWPDALDEDSQRRLDDPNDFVRIEIAAALQRDIPVIPILMEGAKVPKARQLPDDLRELAIRNGMEVRHTAFGKDMERLVEELKQLLVHR